MKESTVAMMIGMVVFLSGCAASLTDNLVRNIDPVQRQLSEELKHSPSYANTEEAKTLKVPELWKDEAMKDKVLFEGFTVQTPNGPERRIRMTYVNILSKKEADIMGHIKVLAIKDDNSMDALMDIGWLDWKQNPEAMKGLVRSFKKTAEIPIGNMNLGNLGFAMAKVSPAFIKETFMGDEPVVCRSLVDMKDIPNGFRNKMGMPIDMNPAMAVMTVAALALPVVGQIAAPALTGAGAVATTVGYGAAAAAGQAAIGVTGSVGAGGVQAGQPGDPQALPACVNFTPKKK